jgi:two-component system, OmpR family, phosphate regulon sensor histidine kinase PhoR
MESSSPKQISVYIAFIITFIFASSLFILQSANVGNKWGPIVILIVFLFLSVYFIVYYTLTNFIFKRIQPIYKTIHEYTLTQKEFKKQLDKDIISHVNREVEDWAENKTKEIKKLKQLEKYRKQFLGNVMHELKTPIFNIQGYILTLLDGGLEDPSINRLYLQRTEKSINRMILIVEDLESISRLESGEMKLDIEKFDIVKLVEEVFEMHEMRAKQKSIKLSITETYNKSIKVIADRKRMLDVLNNLIINSINYGRKNGKTTVSFMDMGDNILIDVSDNGIGITEKDLPRIFERFYRTDKSRSRDQGGTGLGLAIVKHVLEAHGQTINVRSKLDKGSSFAFTLKKGE